MKFDRYDTGGFYDEMFLAAGCPRPGARLLVQKIEALSEGELQHRQQAAERALLHMGITFNVYGDDAGTERIFPFDISRASSSRREWERHRARPEAAHPRPEPLHRRHLPRPADPQGRRRPRGA